MCPLAAAFYREGAGTRLRLCAEILEGCWDALFSGRADLVIGAPSDAPPEHGAAVRPLGEVQFVFAVAPEHPLAQAAEPIRVSDILQHRIVIAADTSRNLPPRSVGLSNGQDTLTVPTMQAKLGSTVPDWVWASPVNIAGQLLPGRLVRKIRRTPQSHAHVALTRVRAGVGKGRRFGGGWRTRWEPTGQLALLA